MKQIEAFTFGKKLGLPNLNEDSMVVMPGRGYAVIDGVTDRNGTQYDGMLSGQFASRTVSRAIERFLLEQHPGGDPELRYRGPAELIAYLNHSLLEGYERNDAGQTAREDWKIRAGCTLMIAFHRGEDLQVVAVGDSGIRFNGTDILQPLKALDDVTAILRRETFNFLTERGTGRDDAESLSTAVTWHGTRHQTDGMPTAAPAVVEALETRALAACVRHLPDAPRWELLELIHHGIVHGQGDFQNVTDRMLGYGCLDGFELPAQFVETRSLRTEDVETIELFSDCYFQPGLEFGIASWEESFEAVEVEDPLKIGRYMSTKGTTKTVLTDDRTYLGVRLL